MSPMLKLRFMARKLKRVLQQKSDVSLNFVLRNPLFVSLDSPPNS